ncbi:helix-turn-helix domain-containing protein [Bradyrhizobium cosmicum]|uniref:helix-turn-helix domain-containing protein n=1 Tax=Bradyrhizobium cosmicum TaxID=1404864 RepID=UPI001FCF22A9|nr:helix-turn-helix domain-containing protein [Bradyrhizobium cosmicum]
MTTHVLQFVELSDRDRKAAKDFAKPGKGDHVEVRIRRKSGEDQVVRLPPKAAALIETALGRLLQGERVAVLAEDQELSPNDAADILGISRPLVVQRMDSHDLPFRYVGKHRRTKLRDVLALKSQMDARQAALKALVEDAENVAPRDGAGPAKTSKSAGSASNRGSAPKNVDQIVLGTTNAPYRRTISSTDLVARIASRDWQNWIAHVVTFFTEVRPELVLQFARRHAISTRDLTAAYRSMKSATGETNPALERALERLA